MSDGLATLLKDAAAALQRADWTAARDGFGAVLEQAAVPEALMGRADALWWLGDLDGAMSHRQQAFDAFQEAGDGHGATFAALLVSMDYVKQYGDAVAGRAWLAHARRLVESRELEPMRGWLQFAEAFAEDEPTRCEQLARAAEASARELGDEELARCALAQVGAALVEQGLVAEGLRCIDEALALSLAEGGSRDSVVFTSCVMMTACTQCAEFERAVHWVRATSAFSEVNGCPFLYAECRILYAGVLLATGEWGLAEEELRTGIEMTQQAVPALHRLALATLAELWLVQGRIGDAERLLAGHEEHAEVAPVLARLHLARGEPSVALATVRRRLEARRELGLESAVLLEIAGSALIEDGAVEAAHPYAARLLGLGEAGGCALVQARGHRLLGRIAAAGGEVVDARRSLDAALVAFARLEMRYEAAVTRRRIAETLREAEPRVAAAEAKAANATFQAIGARVDADLTAELLRGLGVRVGVSGPRGSAVLSRREDEVLALLGEGLSNPEIAARLHLSRKTVEHHVASVLAKLGLRSRTEAAAEAVRRMGAAQPR